MSSTTAYSPEQLKALFYYQLRIDANDDVKTHINLGLWIELNNAIKYHCIHEISEKGKPHWHLFLAFSKKLNAKQINRMRNWWINKTADTYQPLSFTKIKCVKGMWTYINKKPNTLTGLKSSELSNITNNDALFFANYKQLLQRKDLKKDKLSKLIKSQLSDTTRFEQFCIIYVHAYHKVYTTYPSSKYKLYATALAFNQLSVEQYLSAIHVDMYLTHDKQKNYASIMQTLDAYQSSNNTNRVITQN